MILLIMMFRCRTNTLRNKKEMKILKSSLVLFKTRLTILRELREGYANFARDMIHL